MASNSLDQVKEARVTLQRLKTTQSSCISVKKSARKLSRVAPSVRLVLTNSIWKVSSENLRERTQANSVKISRMLKPVLLLQRIGIESSLYLDLKWYRFKVTNRVKYLKIYNQGWSIKRLLMPLRVYILFERSQTCYKAFL